ncbi:hypothetical protein GCM10023201_03360 [Actinomycetospora corticicola]|uniref:Uncharacterized protein n=1 Tax=Actinomycetospora corticicola TaxID=663602 RepID=A0A7Y9J963_9PSEU|nr:hypothetical protein [Actinomycetospora corticicola]
MTVLFVLSGLAVLSMILLGLFSGGSGAGAKRYPVAPARAIPVAPAVRDASAREDTDTGRDANAARHAA